jgi:hypothetical protein
VQEIVNMAAVAVIDAQQRSPTGAPPSGAPGGVAPESAAAEAPTGLPTALSRI